MSIMNNELYHHGIKGQRWGIRRFQNEDGTRTAAGRARRNDYTASDTEGGSRRKGVDKEKLKKVAKGAAIAAVVAAGTYYAVKHPEQAKALANKVLSASKDIGVKTLKVSKDIGGKALVKGGEVATKVGKHVVERLIKAEDAAIDAAILSVGGIGISKVNEKYVEKEGDSEATKNIKQIQRDAYTAAISAATKSSNGNNKGNKGNKGGSVGAEVTSAIGSPSNKGIDKSSREYQALFKDSSGNNRPDDVRSTIKSMANAGYDIDQISQYLDKFAHSAVYKNFTYSNELYHSCIIVRRRY